VSDLPENELPLVLLVDDDTRLREQLARAMASRGYAVRTAGSYDDAMLVARETSPEYAVVDLRMPGPSGLELVRGLKDLDPETRIIVLTGYGSIATTIDAMRLGAVYYMQKPADADDVIAAFAKADAPPLESIPESGETPSLERVKWEHVSRVLT